VGGGEVIEGGGEGELNVVHDLIIPFLG
jgi:hypothetical protein